MTRQHDELAEWPDAIESLLEKLNGPFKRITVLRETASTQDAAKGMNAQPGDIIVAGRQTAGRGRLGRAWADTKEEGLAVTFVLDGAAGERLAIVSAVAAAQAAELILNHAVGIKWPNDIVVEGTGLRASHARKLGGVLIERTNDVALVGIGMNVLQSEWPDELAEKAISMRQAGARDATRLAALKALIRAIHTAIDLDHSELLGAYTARDVLKGRHASFQAGNRRISGTVLNVDPLHGLRVKTEFGDEWLPAATTRLADSSPPDRVR